MLPNQSFKLLKKSQRKIEMSEFHERIKQERERLGFTQEEFAALAGKKRTAQQGYEREGGAKPDLSYLSAIHKSGADILYITTGYRQEVSTPMVGVIEKAIDETSRHSGSPSGLSPVAELVSLFEQSSPGMQQAVLALLRAK